MGIGRKPQNIRHFNNKVVARLLLENNLSCREIQKKIGLTHAAIRDITERLSKMNLIKVSNDVPQKRDRGGQHIRYTVDPERAYFVCINFQHACGSINIFDLKGKRVWGEKLSDKFVDKAYFCEIMLRLKSKLSELGIPEDLVGVISVSISGQINQFTGKMIISFRIGDDFVIKDELNKAFPHAKIDIKNDIVYCCMGSILSDEFDYESGASLFVYVGDGIANVFVYNKQIVTGASGFSGEIGANYIAPGKHLYDVLAKDYLINAGKKLLGDPSVTMDNVIKLSKDNPELQKEFRFVAEVLGKMIRNAIDITGCSHIVVSGLITAYPEIFYDKLTETLKDCVYSAGIDYRIDRSKNNEALFGQVAISKLLALDWVMEQY